MDRESHEADKREHKEKKKAKIEVDNHPKHVPTGSYVVSDLKAIVDVPSEKDLDQVIDGNLTTLRDDATVRIEGGEIFFSHVRRGGSS